MENKNQRIWDQVNKTDPGNVKEVSYGRKFSAIDAYSQIQKATEVFGPCGMGWGYEVVRDVLEGHFFVELTLWYVENEKRYNMPTIYEMIVLNNKGKIDHEAPKKCITSALTKSLSYLGFNCDVFLGKFDDSKYVEQRKEEVRKERIENQSAYPDEDFVKNFPKWQEMIKHKKTDKNRLISQMQAKVRLSEDQLLKIEAIAC